ncbi:hypothetical protein HMPREF9069_00224 [Atopobium sp. oral taxon 810 str. F0209]|nr:hypothetical protein HMPREF9069_00224 [Atopobium sp. oral taxon 810 str. F0209]
MFCLPNATYHFKRYGPACQKPRITSNDTVLLAKSHVLLHFFSQKPHISSRPKNLPAKT